MGTAAKQTVNLVQTLLLLGVSWLVVAAGLAATPVGEISFSTDCSAAWCANDRVNPVMDQQAQDLVGEQLTELGCDRTQRLTDQVAVTNAAKTKDGVQQFDTAVVRVVSFDEGWALAKQGKVFVQGWCS